MKRFFISIIIILAGVGSMVALVKASGTEERVEPAPIIQKVEVLTVHKEAQQSKIYGSGVVQPTKQVSLMPQVGGKIVYVAKDLSVGKLFQKGEVIAKIQQTDYQLALRQEKARVQQAKLNLQIEQERLDAAQREWELLGNEGAAPDLASRKPHLELMKVNFDAALASQERAELNLERTILKAPFSGVIKQEQLEVGQIVGGAPVGVFLGTDAFFVRASIPASRLGEIDIPDINADKGSEVIVRYQPSSRTSIEKRGRIARLEGELDQQARTATILVQIDNPLEGDDIPLLLGSYVDIEIVGKTVEDSARIPNTAIRDGSFVLVADSEDKLARKDIEIGWVDKEDVIVLSGLEEGDRIIKTSISYPLYGSPLDIVTGE